MGILRRTAKNCRNCPIVDICEKKEMEAEAYLEPASIPFAESVTAPIMRETMDIMVDGHFQKVYKDEIERQLQMSLFPERFIKHGV